MASFQLPALRRRAPIGRRAIAFLLVLGVHLLLVAVLIMLAPPRPPGKGPTDPIVVRLLPQPAAKPKPQVRRTEGARPKRTPPTPITPPKPPPPVEEKLGTVLFDAFDIRSLPNTRDNAPAATGMGDSGEGNSSDSVAEAGAGPNGEPLYQAEWEREPTNAELSFYIPRGAPPDSWGVIACRTIARNRVDDCRELGDAPRGSGLARALAQAAWQFRVLPPRVGGRKLIGAWVSIRIDFSREGPATR